ncbi:sugar phosphate nucleotidyltransferase [Bacillus sp. SL00103]
MKKVRKAIIPGAGLGTRFLLQQKRCLKKCSQSLINQPIQYIIEEAVESGIEDIIIVTGRKKEPLRIILILHQSRRNLEEKGKASFLEKVRKSSNIADIHYIRQKEPKGLGHAVWCARNFIGDEPFAVLLGDDIVQAETPGLRQLMDEYEKTLSSVIRSSTGGR